jgi:carboxyl-terminal processing protease
MNHNQRLLSIGIIILFSFAAGFLAGEHTETKTNHTYSEAATVTEAELAPVWKAWELLEEKFVPASSTEKATKQENIWGIISGLANSYNDPYTVFFPPEQAQNFQEEISGQFGGIGVEIGVRDGVLTAIAPLKGTPAESAGLRSGDLIIEIDGVSTRSMTIDEAVEAIRGEVDTIVLLTIAREGENEFLEIPVTRAIIDIPTSETEMRNDGVFVLSLYNFGGTATSEFRTALRTFKESDSSKLIIDLRGNPGGYLEAAVEIASWFLPSGKVVVTEDYGSAREPIIHRSKGYDIVEDNWDIALLIDGGSASASEILAGALKEHGVATLIGEKTFGKGSVQELVDVTEDTSIKITVARWLTPNGVSLSNNGLVPDLEVEYSMDNVEEGIDPQLDAAVTFLLTGELKAPQKDETTEGVDTNEEIE